MPTARDIFLDGRTHDILGVSVIPEINDFDPVPDELEVDGIDGAVVPVTNRNSGENSDRRSHGV